MHANAGLPVRVRQRRHTRLHLKAHPSSDLQLAFVGTTTSASTLTLWSLARSSLDKPGWRRLGGCYDPGWLGFGGGPNSETTQLTEPRPKCRALACGHQQPLRPCWLRGRSTGAGPQTANTVVLPLSLTGSRRNLGIPDWGAWQGRSQTSRFPKHCRSACRSWV